MATLAVALNQCATMQIPNVANLMTFKGDRKGRHYKHFIPEVGVGVGVGVGLTTIP